MKKLLLGTAAICGLAMATSPAQAQVSLDLGGYMKGYVFYTDQDDDTAAANSRELDIVRNTEIHASGETTLDNGLTVGFHTELEADGNTADSTEVQESYAYFSGDWGRVNFGAEDGASYLLQVAVPSADSNIDGIRQYVNPVNYASTGGTGVNASFDESGTRGGIDYDQDLTGYDDKLTYLSPVLNGFQVALSYTPDTADASDEDANNTDDVDGALGEAYEIAGRYEGNFNNVGFTVGAGYTSVDLEDNTTNPGGNDDDQEAWNVGLDLDIGPFGIGVAYMEDNFAENSTNSNEDDEETFVVGVDYTTGPFKLGASYLDIENTGDVTGNDGNGIESDRWTGGVVYTYGPGMTFRGSLSHVEHDNVAGLTSGDSIEATSVTLGTQINF